MLEVEEVGFSCVREEGARTENIIARERKKYTAILFHFKTYYIRGAELKLIAERESGWFFLIIARAPLYICRSESKRVNE